MRSVLPILALWLISCALARSEIVPVPESIQAAQAMRIIDDYHGSRPATSPKKLYVIYFTPAGRDPAPGYEPRLTAILKDIQSFYRSGMVQHGFGPEMFPLECDAQSNVVIHLVKGKEAEKDYNKPDDQKIAAECLPALQAAGGSFDEDTVLIICNLATWDEKAGTFSHHSPYYGMWGQTWGRCFVVDSAILNLDDITTKQPLLNDDEYGKMSLGKFNSVFIGGFAHEMGHAFGLPHCGERWDEKKFGTSIMGDGNHMYHDELRGEDPGAFLTMASAMHLAGRPLFNGADKGIAQDATLSQCEITLSTHLTRPDLAGRKGGLRVEGRVTGSPPVYGVIVYFDSYNDGGYDASAATSVPDARGRFAIEASDLAPCGNGQLRVEFCHANGAISERQLGFAVSRDGRVDLSQWQLRRALMPLARAVADNKPEAAQAALQALEKSDASELAKTIGRKLAGTLDMAPKQKPADVPGAISSMALGDAQPESAKVGWLHPAANRVPLDQGVTSPFLDCEKLYATGLFAHAPSSYVFALGGKWRELKGEAGLHTLEQPYGSVIFSIKADGREVFRSPVIEHDRKASYEINLTGVKQLELNVEPAADNNHNDWGLWLDPMLSR